MPEVEEPANAQASAGVHLRQQRAWQHDGMSRGLRAVTGLAASCHPVPTIAVTVLSTVLVVAAGNGFWTCVLAAAAVLTGQLVIGWSNDAIDARRDREAGRRDKPVALGLVTSRTIWVATATATAATVPLSLALGWRAGALAMSVVCWGLLYNAWLKSTLLSPLPFLLAFGALPAVATTSLPGHPWPPAWTMVAAGLIGVAAHFGNVVPDLDDDRLTGVRGLPHLVGRYGSSVLAVGSAFAATVVAVAVEAGGPGALWVLTVAAGAVAGGALVIGRRDPHSDVVFHATMVIAAIDVALIVVTDALG